MSLEENKTLVREFLEQVWNKKNLAVIDDTLSASFVIHNGSSATVPPGPDVYRQFAIRFLDAFPDLHTTIEQVVAEEDKVAVHGTDQATHRGEYMGIAPTGKSITVTWTGIYRVVDGKIVEEWINGDSLGLQ